MTWNKDRWTTEQAKRMGVSEEAIRKAFQDELDAAQPLDAPLQVPDRIDIDYRYSYGEISRFFRELLRRTVFDKVSVIPTGYGAYFMEFLYTARRKGLKICEEPYRFTDRRHGESKSAPNLIRFLITGMAYVIRILVARMRPIG